MPSQLRIYKIKHGQMANWLRFFEEKVVPLQRKYGIVARIAWVNSTDSEFIWVRDFADGESIEAQENRYATSDERKHVIGDEPKAYLESAIVRMVDLVFEKTLSD